MNQETLILTVHDDLVQWLGEEGTPSAVQLRDVIWALARDHDLQLNFIAAVCQEELIAEEAQGGYVNEPNDDERSVAWGWEQRGNDCDSSV